MEFYSCFVTEKAIKNAISVLEDEYLNQGPWVKKVETCFQNTYGIEHPVTLNSCTAALHLSLTISKVKGKEVILPAKTFIATGTAVLAAGGIPVFCDINPYIGCLTEEKVSKKINENTAAVIGVSWGGSTYVSRELKILKDKFPHVYFIEDAAHSFTSTFMDRNLIDFVCYSFQAVKSINCGDGGLLQCKTLESADKARALRWFGVDKNKMEFSDIGERLMDIEEAGFKYNMNDLNAAILYGNMELTAHRIDRRKTIFNKVCKEISRVGGIKVMEHSANSTYWMFPLLVERRDDFIRALRDREVPATKTDRRIDSYSVFGGLTPGLSGTELFESMEANLPIHDNLTYDDMDLIINSIKKGW